MTGPVVVVGGNAPKVTVTTDTVLVQLSNTGFPGVGVPSGGTTGQVLAKASDDDYDDEWIDPPSGGGSVDSVNNISPVSGNVTLLGTDVITLTTTGSSGQATLVGSALNIPQYSGGSGDNTAIFSPIINQVGHGFSDSPPQAIYSTDSDGYALGQSNTVNKSDIAGLVTTVIDADHFIFTLAGKVPGEFDPGDAYFLSDTTPGLITTTEPETAGYLSKPLLYGQPDGSGILQIGRGIVIADASTASIAGTPVAGNLTKFVSPTAIANADLTGDISTSGGTATALATVNSNVGSFGSASLIPTITVNGKGLITAASTNTVAAPSSTLVGTILAPNVVTSSLTSVGTLSSLNVAGATTLTGTETITSASTGAFSVGAAGATNPVFNVDASVASVKTGISIKGAASAGQTTITASGDTANAGIILTSIGTGALSLISGAAMLINSVTSQTFQISGVSKFTIGAGVSYANAPSSSSTPRFSWVSAADTGLAATGESTLVDWNMGTTRQHATGTLTLERNFRVRNSGLSFVAASTCTDHATFSVDGATLAQTNATITNSSAIYTGGVAVGAGVVNSYGINIIANTGATNNYSARFAGSAGEALSIRTDGKLSLLNTITATGTTGAVTINKPSGTVNIAAAGTSVVVTNSLCTTSSLVFCAVRTADTTAYIKNVVPAAGSFTITLGAAATAETSVGFFVIN